MNNIESAMRDGITDKCHKQCCYCKHFMYLNSDIIGVCGLAYDEWVDDNRGTVSCSEALRFFEDYAVLDDEECERTGFEEY